MNEFESLLPIEAQQRLREYREWKAQRIAEIGQEAFDMEMAEERRKENEGEEAKKIQARSIEVLAMSGLEKEIIEKRFNNFEIHQDWQRRMYDLCQEYIGQDKFKFLYLSGQPGCGKTHLGTAVCGYFISAGYSTVYAIHAAMLKDLKAHVNDDDYEDVQTRYTRPQVLYIDDFMKPAKVDGKIYPPTGADITHSFEAINLRVIQKKITVITSERSLGEIIRIDEALGSRIKQMCGKFTLDIERKAGRNWRLKG